MAHTYDMEPLQEDMEPFSLWLRLPADLADRVASFLRPNEIACNLRLVNKAAAAQFGGPQHTKVRLSQPVPPHEFARRWGAPGATRGLPYRQRLKLLCLTAASGSISNMEVAIRAAGCLPTKEVFQAAAAAGQLAMCEWLLQRGCPHDGALGAAAEAGQRDTCEWLLGQGDSFVDPDASHAAARGGHVDLMEWLMRTRPDRFRLPADHVGRAWLLAAVAEGCDLATLQRLHHEWLGAPQEGAGGQQLPDGLDDVAEVVLQGRLFAAAAGSPTPDWRDKVEWLEGRGYPVTKSACEEAATCPDALERLAWLRRRGYPTVFGAALAAARAGNLAALQYLHAKGAKVHRAEIVAAREGHLSVVAWLAEAPGVGVNFTEGLFNAAAQSGSVELLAWLRERGCPWNGETFNRAAVAGSEAALEWLAEQGCPMGDGGSLAHLPAVHKRDLATVRCLARLGCPWGPPGALFEDALREVFTVRYEPEMLRVLLAAGCPMDWEAAEKAVVRYCRRWGHVRAEELLALLAEERARRGG